MKKAWQYKQNQPMIIRTIILTGLLLAIACSPTNQKEIYHFKKIALSQGKYIILGDLEDRSDRLKVMHVLGYYNLHFQLNEDSEILVFLAQKDTNLMYNIYHKSQDADWYDTHIRTLLEF